MAEDIKFNLRVDPRFNGRDAAKTKHAALCRIAATPDTSERRLAIPRKSILLVADPSALGRALTFRGIDTVECDGVDEPGVDMPSTPRGTRRFKGADMADVDRAWVSHTGQYLARALAPVPLMTRATLANIPLSPEKSARARAIASILVAIYLSTFPTLRTEDPRDIASLFVKARSSHSLGKSSDSSSDPDSSLPCS